MQTQKYGDKHFFASLLNGDLSVDSPKKNEDFSIEGRVESQAKTHLFQDESKVEGSQPLKIKAKNLSNRIGSCEWMDDLSCEEKKLIDHLLAFSPNFAEGFLFEIFHTLHALRIQENHNESFQTLLSQIDQIFPLFASFVLFFSQRGTLEPSLIAVSKPGECRSKASEQLNLREKAITAIETFERKLTTLFELFPLDSPPLDQQTLKLFEILKKSISGKGLPLNLYLAPSRDTTLSLFTKRIDQVEKKSVSLKMVSKLMKLFTIIEKRLEEAKAEKLIPSYKKGRFHNFCLTLKQCFFEDQFDVKKIIDIYSYLKSLERKEYQLVLNPLDVNSSSGENLVDFYSLKTDEFKLSFFVDLISNHENDLLYENIKNNYFDLISESIKMTSFVLTCFMRKSTLIYVFKNKIENFISELALLLENQVINFDLDEIAPYSTIQKSNGDQFKNYKMALKDLIKARDYLTQTSESDLDAEQFLEMLCYAKTSIESAIITPIFLILNKYLLPPFPNHSLPIHQIDTFMNYQKILLNYTKFHDEIHASFNQFSASGEENLEPLFSNPDEARSSSSPSELFLPRIVSSLSKIPPEVVSKTKKKHKKSKIKQKVFNAEDKHFCELFPNEKMLLYPGISILESVFLELKELRLNLELHLSLDIPAEALLLKKIACLFPLLTFTFKELVDPSLNEMIDSTMDRKSLISLQPGSGKNENSKILVRHLHNQVIDSLSKVLKAIPHKAKRGESSQQEADCQRFLSILKILKNSVNGLGIPLEEYLSPVQLVSGFRSSIEKRAIDSKALEAQKNGVIVKIELLLEIVKKNFTLLESYLEGKKDKSYLSQASENFQKLVAMIERQKNIKIAKKRKILQSPLQSAKFQREDLDKIFKSIASRLSFFSISLTEQSLSLGICRTINETIDCSKLLPATKLEEKSIDEGNFLTNRVDFSLFPHSTAEESTSEACPLNVLINSFTYDGRLTEKTMSSLIIREEIKAISDTLRLINLISEKFLDFHINLIPHLLLEKVDNIEDQLSILKQIQFLPEGGGKASEQLGELLKRKITSLEAHVTLLKCGLHSGFSSFYFVPLYTRIKGNEFDGIKNILVEGLARNQKSLAQKSLKHETFEQLYATLHSLMVIRAVQTEQAIPMINLKISSPVKAASSVRPLVESESGSSSSSSSPLPPSSEEKGKRKKNKVKESRLVSKGLSPSDHSPSEETLDPSSRNSIEKESQRIHSAHVDPLPSLKVEDKEDEIKVQKTNKSFIKKKKKEQESSISSNEGTIEKMIDRAASSLPEGSLGQKVVKGFKKGVAFLSKKKPLESSKSSSLTLKWNYRKALSNRDHFDDEAEEEINRAFPLGSSQSFKSSKVSSTLHSLGFVQYPGSSSGSGHSSWGLPGDPRGVGKMTLPTSTTDLSIYVVKEIKQTATDLLAWKKRQEFESLQTSSGSAGSP